MIEFTTDSYSVKLCKENTTTCYLFGDNLKQIGKKGQAIIRDQPNSFGIYTKKYPSMYSSSFYRDTDLNAFKELVDVQLVQLKAFIKDGQYTRIVCNSNIGAGLAKLPELAPRCYEYLITQLKAFSLD